MKTGRFGLTALSLLIGLAAQGKDIQSRDKFHAAVESCISENQDKLSGERPGRPGDDLTEAQKADQKILEACLASKGIAKPKRGEGHHGPPPGPPPEEGDSSAVQ